ncbi:MAG: 3-deoxy-D-manno-octulosonic acid transferase [Chitinophagaceae bacterium]|nr:3-deoxy-D-manno-octulosonic acid transferase [Chitinophagaceae bacterium]
MGVILYNIFLVFLKTGIHIASLFDRKAKKWVAGRKNIFEKLEAATGNNDKVIWMHCASLGEFEQGRPLIERLSTHYPTHKILLTFFSPSGYEVQKDYKGADWVFYLPVDGPLNAKRFLEIVKPSLVIFVKYEFWFYYLKKIKYRNIPLLLVSALFRKDMSFFKWYGGLQRKMLSRFDHLFVQNEPSKKMIGKIGLTDICSVSGDTRFDRVIEIAEKFQPIPAIEQFIGHNQALIAGSTWKEDEEMLQKVFSSGNDSSLKLIIAPHEINEDHIHELRMLFTGAVLFSELASGNQQAETGNTLIIDNIGMLSRLYHYGHIAFVGGAFRKSGVHNVLEAAVHGKPVLYGPEYKKYSEAIELVRSGGGICVNDADECIKTIQALLSDESYYKLCADSSFRYVWKNKGATERIIQFIQEKRLLTI